MAPGYKQSRITPLVGAGGLTSARCNLRTPNGELASEWKHADGELTVAVTIPANTSAEVVIPAAKAEAVREGKVLAVAARGVKDSIFEAGRLTLRIGSGNYKFTARGSSGSWKTTPTTP